MNHNTLHKPRRAHPTVDALGDVSCKKSHPTEKVNNIIAIFALETIYKFLYSKKI